MEAKQKTPSPIAWVLGRPGITEDNMCSAWLSP